MAPNTVHARRTRASHRTLHAPGGPLADSVGRKGSFAYTATACAVGAALCASAPTCVPHCAWQCIEELRGKREELNTSIATDEEEKGVATFRAGAASLWPSSSP